MTSYSPTTPRSAADGPLGLRNPPHVVRNRVHLPARQALLRLAPDGVELIVLGVAEPNAAVDANAQSTAAECAGELDGAFQ